MDDLGDEPSGRTALALVSQDPDVRDAVGAELTKRYAADYVVLIGTDWADIETQLDQTPAAVAVALAGYATGDFGGIEVLAGIVSFGRKPFCAAGLFSAIICGWASGDVGSSPVTVPIRP